jgi:hypothetical protein
MRASDRIKSNAGELQVGNNHDKLCGIVDNFLSSEKGRRQLFSLWRNGPMRYAEDSGDEASVDPPDWEYPIIQKNSPTQFNLKGFCDVSACFFCLTKDKVEHESRVFVECKPSHVNVGEAIRQLRYYRHHYGKPCELVLATFDSLDTEVDDRRVDALLQAEIALWTFVDDKGGWRVWSY